MFAVLRNVASGTGRPREQRSWRARNRKVSEGCISSKKMGKRTAPVRESVAVLPGSMGSEAEWSPEHDNCCRARRNELLPYF